MHSPLKWHSTSEQEKNLSGRRSLSFFNFIGDVHSILFTDFHHSEINLLSVSWNNELQEKIWGSGNHRVVLCVPFPVEGVTNSEVHVALFDRDETCLEVKLSKVDIKLVWISCFMRSGKCNIVQDPATSKWKVRRKMMGKTLGCKKSSLVISV